MNFVKKFFKFAMLPFIMIKDIIEVFVIYMPGSTGKKLRYFYWKKRFKRCGKNVIIDEGVIIYNPQYISIGDNVWIDKYSVLMAGKVNLNSKYLKKRENLNFKFDEGELVIGSGVHIGMHNIIQAHGGVHIGDNVTTSAGVKIYSLSNLVKDDKYPTEVLYANYLAQPSEKVGYIISPIVIEEGVWIGLNSIVLGKTIGKNSFIAPFSVVLYDIEPNSYCKGFPAKRIKNRFNNK